MDIEEYLRKFQVQGPDPALRERVLASAARRERSGLRPRAWLLYASAAAAVMLLAGLGWWKFAGNSGYQRDVAVSPSADDPAAVAIFHGQGRLLPVTRETRFAVVDADRGRVRLDAGELYVEVPVGSQFRPEVQTSAGTATGSGCPFLAHCGPTDPSQPGSLLAVTSLGGKVEISNSHGGTFGEVGEIVLATAAAARNVTPKGTMEWLGVPSPVPWEWCIVQKFRPSCG